VRACFVCAFSVVGLNHGGNSGAGCLPELKIDLELLPNDGARFCAAVDPDSVDSAAVGGEPDP
jgi:hypothetical protein